MELLFVPENDEVIPKGQKHEEYPVRKIEKTEIEVLVVDEKDHGPGENSVFGPESENQFSENEGGKEEVQEDDGFFGKGRRQESSQEGKKEMGGPVGHWKRVYGE